MNLDQKIYRRFVLLKFEERHYDLAATLGWCQRNPLKISDPERKAIHRLTIRQKNEVLQELITMALAKGEK
ncbi:hypothetical protein [Levilactobacillus namurensis]|uniref:hypothetical protein n=1 Tax=Levilactobacillus namurensis TaxID=380393 RepID=UPI0004658589|nr:hypothetical protein [Levilactobacillus namurensis]